MLLSSLPSFITLHIPISKELKNYSSPTINKSSKIIEPRRFNSWNSNLQGQNKPYSSLSCPKSDSIIFTKPYAKENHPIELNNCKREYQSTKKLPHDISQKW